MGVRTRALWSVVTTTVENSIPGFHTDITERMKQVLMGSRRTMCMGLEPWCEGRALLEEEMYVGRRYGTVLWRVEPYVVNKGLI